jgi:hypothetical protein
MDTVRPIAVWPIWSCVRAFRWRQGEAILVVINVATRSAAHVKWLWAAGPSRPELIRFITRERQILYAGVIGDKPWRRRGWHEPGSAQGHPAALSTATG